MRAGLIAVLVLGLATASGAAGQSEPAQLDVTQDGNVTQINVTGAGTYTTVINEVLALRQRGRDADADILAMIEADRETLPPPYYLEAARRTCERDPQAALDWLALYSLRARYDGARCIDDTAMESIQMSLVSLQMPECQGTLTSGDGLLGGLERAVDRTDLFDSEVSPWWICSSGMSVIMGVMDGKSISEDDEETWLKPEAEWPAIQASLLDDLKTSIALHKGK